MKVFDADNQILGRMCSIVAKELLRGEKVVVVNAEKAVLSASRSFLEKEYANKYERGDPGHGPFFPKTPERIFRRTVRGMIPWDRTVGREAFKNLRVFIGVPEELKSSTTQKLKEADASKLKTKYIKLGDISISIGAKKRW